MIEFRLIAVNKLLLNNVSKSNFKNLDLIYTSRTKSGHSFTVIVTIAVIRFRGILRLR